MLTVVILLKLQKMQSGCFKNIAYLNRWLSHLRNVLYVNKQEFSALSWRSNQGYTKMHGQPTIKMNFNVNKICKQDGIP
jgi:hypothetical protein